MNAKITIKDCLETSTYNAYEITSKEAFDYEESKGRQSHINVYNNGVVINRVDKDHSSFIHLIKDDSYIEVTTNEGKIKIDVKLVEISINNDIVVIVYQVDSITKELNIKYY